MYTTEEQICILLGHYEVKSAKFYQLLDMYGDCKGIADGIMADKSAEKILGAGYSAIKKALKKCEYDVIISALDKNGVRAVTYCSQQFPDSLRCIDDPPYILFCKGDVSLLNTRCLAVIGTRKASAYGRRVAKDFTAVLSEYFTIVSGLAYGVDCIAHESTLDEQGKTIAVLGGGVIDVYPSGNQSLADRIVANGGLLVSEYGMYAQPLAYRFPHRNRIVAGLSSGVLVCQAPAKSGTNSTVELALEQGKDIFAVPGEIYDLGFGGSNKLIKSIQAACVTTPRDIIDFYNLAQNDKPQQTYQISFDEQKIVDLLTVEPLTFDQLVAQSGMGAADLNFLLANLEIRSIIVRLPGNLYRLYGGLE